MRIACLYYNKKHYYVIYVIFLIYHINYKMLYNCIIFIVYILKGHRIYSKKYIYLIIMIYYKFNKRKMFDLFS